MKFSVSWGNKENREIFNKTIFNNSEYQEKKRYEDVWFFPYCNVIRGSNSPAR